MCGAVARVGRGGIGDAMRALRHRGIRNAVADLERGSVGHVRLPIVGLGLEDDQPMRRDNWTIAFVGELLDFRDTHPDASCDARVVADLWVDHRWFRNRDGFWHVIALDDRTGCIHVVCDYLAQKPAYYRSDEHAIAAASEPDAVAALGPTTPDEVYFASVIKWGYCPEPRRTPYREVHKVMAGEHVMLWPSGHVKREFVDGLVPDRSAGIGGLRREIGEAVRRRVLSSDVPVAALVSGGLDSAITYALAKRHSDVSTYHVQNGELDAFEEVHRAFSTNTPTILEPRGVGDEKALRYMQEPLDLGSLVPQVAVSDAIGAAGSERVCLTGDGADELFGGYGRALRYDSQASDVWHELQCWHLPRLDRVMMRNRIEVRSPFLARRVAEIALGLPWEMRRDKLALREAFRDELPSSVVERAKRPLRTREVEEDREARSQKLVNMFRRAQWPS